MLLEIPNLLPPSEYNLILDMLSRGKFVDGKLSAGSRARAIKNNLEMEPNEKLINDLNNILMRRLVEHPTFQSFVLPCKVASPFYVCYEKGMSYGAHIDDPIMGPPQYRYRSDVSITIFLNSPQDYQGGELSIQTNFGPSEVKLAAGSAVLYPSSSLHQVREITEGRRIVAVTWAQSHVRSAEQRDVLYELHLARQKLLNTAALAEETAQVDHVYTNLVRMWSDV